MPPIIAVAIIAAVVGLIVLGFRALLRAAAARRGRQLAGPATELGLLPVDALPDGLPPFELLNTGSSRTASNILRGSVRGSDVAVFDYSFHDPRTKGFTGVHYSDHFATTTIACAKGSWLNLPQFAIEPDLRAAVKAAEAEVAQQVGDGKMGKFANTLMSLAEGLAGHQQGWRFSDRPEVMYVVRRGDEAAVRAAFTAPVLDFFRDHRGWILEGQGEWVLVTFSWEFGQPGVDISETEIANGQLPPERLAALVRAATDTVEAFRGAAR